MRQNQLALFSDEELMQKIKAGDNSAFNALYHKHKTDVYSYVFHKTKDKFEAEEITQIVFMKVFENASSYKEEKNLLIG